MIFQHSQNLISMKNRLLLILSLCLIVVIQTMAFRGDNNKTPLKKTKLLQAPLTAEINAQVIVPVAITGFNADVIVNGGPAVSSENIAMLSTTEAMDPRYDVTFYSADYRGADNPSTPPAYGLPTDGIINSVANPGVLYQLADYSSNNVLVLSDNKYKDTLYFTEPASFDKISILATTVEGYSHITAKVLFEDNTAQTKSFEVSEWYNGSPYAITSLGRVTRSTEIFDNSTTGPRLYEYFITVDDENSGKKITGIVFLYERYYWNQYTRTGIFAICGMNLPEKPLITGISATETSLTVSWDTTFLAESYKVQISIDSTFSNPDAQIITYTDIIDTTLTVEGIIPSPVFYARVIGVNTAGDGPASDVKGAANSVAPIFSVEPSELVLTSPNINYSGISVNTNSAWNASSPAYWLPDISGAGSKNFTLVTPANVTSLPRDANLYFYSLGLSDTIAFSQPAMDVINLPFTEDFELIDYGTIPGNFAELNMGTDKRAVDRWEVQMGDSKYVQFNYNYDKEGETTESRLAFPPLNFENYEVVVMTFSMVQNGYYPSQDYVRVQASNDHIATWKNMGDSIPYYFSGLDESWEQQTVDLSEFAGQSDVNLAILGHSETSNLYLDEFQITGYNADIPIALTLDADNIVGDAAMVHGEVSANLLPTDVFFQYGLTTAYGDSVKANPEMVKGYLSHETQAILSGLSPETEYHFRIMAINDLGTVYGEDMTFTTGSAPVAPTILDYGLMANDGNNLILYAQVDPGNGMTLVSYLFGADSSDLVLSETADTLLTEGSSNNLFTGLTEETVYYYKVMAANSSDTVISGIDSILTPKLMYDTLLYDNVFFKGRYLNIGISELGTFGSTAYAPADMHANMDTYGYSPLGFTADQDKDGWYSGTPGFKGDYFLPGSAEEGWGLNIDGVDYNNNQNEYVEDITGSYTSVKDSANMFIADWEGEVNGLSVRQRVRMPKDSLFFTVEVSLRNNNPSTLRNVYYMRNVDPDNEERITGNYTTKNTIEKQNADADNLALVSAVGLDYNTYLGLGTNDARARAYYGGFSNRAAKDVFEMAEDLSTGDTETDDIAIAVSFKIDSLASGECTSLSYAYILDESQLEAALRSTLLSVSGSGEQGATNTLKVCKGSDTPLTINNGEDYEWTWEPAEGLSSTTGNSVTAQNVTTAKTYTATGTYECFVQKFTIELVPVDIPVATITHSPQEVVTGNAIAAMVLGTGNNVTGTTFSWTRSAPEGITTSIPLSGTGLNIGAALEGSFTNSTQNAIDVVFTITPYAPTITACAGNPITATVTVNPVSTGVKEVEEKIGVYPNPVRNYLTIQTNNQEGKYTLVSINGSIVLSGKLNGDNTQVDMSKLNPGVYILNLETGKEVNRIKVIKQ
jgi:hypothetical protein